MIFIKQFPIWWMHFTHFIKWAIVCGGKGRRDHVQYLYHVKNDESRGKNDIPKWHQSYTEIP